MSKRKNPASPHTGGSSSGGGGSVSALLSSDPRLLPRLTAYLQSLPANAAPVSSGAIVDHLRAKYPDYARKPKEFNKIVERVCEKMRREAMAEAEPTAAAAAAADGDAQMSDVQRASDEVVILSSSVAPTPVAVGLPPAPAAGAAATAFASAIGFAAAPAASPTGAAAASPPAVPIVDRASSAPATVLASPDGGNAAKKIRTGGKDPAASPAQLASQSEADEADSVSSDEANSVVELADLNPAGGGGANSAMRNLYLRQQALQQGASAATAGGAGGEGAAAAGSSDGASKDSGRQRKPKEKIAYTTNSVKKSTKKKPATLRASAQFTGTDGGPEAAAAAGAGMGGGDSGSGSSWQPDVIYPTSTYADLGGIEAILQEIRELIEYPLTHPEIYQHLGVEAPRGVLLHGPPGCGKTLLAHCIAGELGVPFLKISAPEVVSGMSGESEQKIRTFFQAALANAPAIMFIDEIDAITPKRATAQREMERRIVAQLLTCMDSLSTANSDRDPSKIVIVIGATNRPDSLDSALRRAGRFDREIALGIPDEAARARILSVMCRDMKVEGGIQGFDWSSIAKKAVGYVGADLMALTREAAVLAINRIFRMVLPTPSLRPTAGALAPPAFNLLTGKSTSPKIEAMNPPAAAAVPNAAAQALTASLTAAAAAASTALVPASSSPRMGSTQAHLIPDLRSVAAQNELSSRVRTGDKLRAHAQPLSDEQLAPLAITYGDFMEALKKVQPSSKREGFATIPDVTWNDIGALDALREELHMTILQPILNPLQFESIGLQVPAGVLLFGPPGCGKTLVAKAIANESGASFLSIKGPELLNQYVGQSERAVRKVFQRARASAPCIIFFDELDALVPKRGGGAGGGDGGSQVSERVVNQLLTEMDGLEERKFVFVIAATNRPDMIDPAMLRPGRLDKLLYVRLPSTSERAAILRKHLRRTPMSTDVDINAVAADPRAEGFSGADIAALCREATLQALREAQQRQKDELASKGVHTQMPNWGSLIKPPAAAPGAAAATPAAPTPSFNLPPLPVLVCMAHFHFAFSKVFPSVSHASRLKYDRMHRQLCRARSTLSEEAPGQQQPNAQQTPASIVLVEDDEANVQAGSASPQVRASSASNSAMPPPQPKVASNAHAALLPIASAPAASASPAAASSVAPVPHAGTILGSLTNASAAAAAAPGSSGMELH